jgi:hypothetical protein
MEYNLNKMSLEQLLGLLPEGTHVFRMADTWYCEREDSLILEQGEETMKSFVMRCLVHFLKIEEAHRAMLTAGGTEYFPPIAINLHFLILNQL